jgi:hypothetical protein
VRKTLPHAQQPLPGFVKLLEDGFSFRCVHRNLL